jgi:predicted aspartyl protease
MATKLRTVRSFFWITSSPWVWSFVCLVMLHTGCSEHPSIEISAVAANVSVVHDVEGRSFLQGVPNVLPNPSSTNIDPEWEDPIIVATIPTSDPNRDEVTLRLLVDTGAEGHLRLARSKDQTKSNNSDIWISSLGTSRSMTIDGEQRSRLGAVRSLRIGKSVLQGVPTIFGDKPGLPCDGIIGLSTVVSLGSMTFDWANKKVTLHQVISNAEATVVPMKWWTPPPAQSVNRELPGASIMVTATINDKPFDVMVDTGTTATLTIPASKARESPLAECLQQTEQERLTSTSVKSAIYRVMMTCSFSVGGQPISVGRNDLVVVFDDSRIPPEFDPPLVLGSRGLRQFSSTTFDFSTDPPQLILVR